MTVLDLIKKSALMLNVEDVLSDQSLDTITSENHDEVVNKNFALNRLFEFCKVVVSEIGSRLPNVKEVECLATDGKILLNIFDTAVKIVGVRDELGYVKHSVVDNYISVPNNGVFVVRYVKDQKITSVLDEIEIYDPSIGEDMLVQGMNAYYCLASGLFEEFNVYNELYSDKLNNLNNLKVFAMPCRSWE